MYEFDVTVTKTGGIRIQAESRDEAAKIIEKMSNQEIEASVSPADRECSDLQKIEPMEFYYQITIPGKGQIFFRAFENLQQPECIISLALNKGLLADPSACGHAVLHDRETYQHNIMDFLYCRMCREREEFQKKMENQPPEYIYSHCGEIQYYEDIVWLLENFAEDEDFNLESIEKLITLEKPIEALYNAYYNSMNFSSVNDQIMHAINEADINFGKKASYHGPADSPI